MSDKLKNTLDISPQAFRFSPLSYFLYIPVMSRQSKRSIAASCCIRPTKIGGCELLSWVKEISRAADVLHGRRGNQFFGGSSHEEFYIPLRTNRLRNTMSRRTIPKAMDMAITATCTL